VPVISGGDGKHQHPSQSLTDLLTIRRERGHIDGLTVAICGDLANGRTVRSLAYLLSKYQDVRLIFVSPPELCMQADVKAHLDEHGVPYEEVANLDAIIERCDVLYQTRIQRNRMDEAAYSALMDRIGESFDVTYERLQRMKQNGVLLHPYPRNREIRTECDRDHRFACERQIENGLFVRMALIEWVLNGRAV
jgi:aspartate carbamoyltransferase catalytic subunit